MTDKKIAPDAGAAAGLSNIIAVVLPSAPGKALGEPFLLDVLRGVGSEAGDRGYHVLLSTGCDRADETNALRALVRSGVVSGMILLTSKMEDALAEELRREHFPFVVLGHPDHDAEISWVDNDNLQAGRAVTEYLVAHGCRRIAFVGATDEYHMMVDRLNGWREALAAASLPAVQSMAIPLAYGENEVKREAAVRMLLRPDRPDGVVASNDAQAVALMDIAGQLGYRVPQDVSFIGFNNTLAGQYSHPALSTVDLNPSELGRHCFALLHDAIQKGGEAVGHLVVPFTLIERESVK